MEFRPGANSVWIWMPEVGANYKGADTSHLRELRFENEKWESGIGHIMEYVKIQYDVNPNHSTYKVMATIITALPEWVSLLQTER